MSVSLDVVIKITSGLYNTLLDYATAPCFFMVISH